jgi:hypothetical protein
MVRLCPRCQRANPAKAVFCHFDGYLLDQGAGASPAGQLLQEFVFPSGRRCRSFDEVVQGCYYEWEEARQLLADGTFSSFLAGIGRADLARAAREAQGNPDRDVGLTSFLAALPATAVQGPKLGLKPRKLVVGPVRVGEKRSAALELLNEGKGLLQGNVHVSDGSEWLRIADADTANGGVSVKTARDQAVTLEADTSKLTVGQNYAGKVLVVTNGGVAEVPIRLDLVVKPFARAPYAGANSPRDLARRMSKDPDAAVALLHNGEIARWFASNGWTYPIAGEPAPGRAAVQQFFEELGLAKPPPITLSEQEFRFRATPPEAISGQVTLRTSSRRIVYGRVESDSPWLVVKTPSVAGDFQATVEFEVESSLMGEDRLYQGTLRVIANAGQAFTIRVQVDVQGNRKSHGGRRAPAPPPVPAQEPILAAVPPPPPAREPARQQAQAQPFDWAAVATAPQPPPPPERTEKARSSSEVTARPPGALQKAPSYRPEPAPTAEPPRHSANVLQMAAVGALVGVLGRLLLVFPADLFARLLGGEAVAGQPDPGSLRAWLEAPSADGVYLRLFVLATWWLGALAGVVLVWRGGGKVTDLFCGLVAGAVLGLAAAATVGCVLVVGDTVPRLLLFGLLGERDWGPALSTPIWIVTAVLCWIGIGAASGLVLGVLGRRGAAVLAALASPLSGLCRVFGLGKAADFLALKP